MYVVGFKVLHVTILFYLILRPLSASSYLLFPLPHLLLLPLPLPPLPPPLLSSLLLFFFFVVYNLSKCSPVTSSVIASQPLHTLVIYL